MQVAGPFSRRYLETMLDEAHRTGVIKHVTSRPSGAAATVALPPLQAGGEMMKWMQIGNEPPNAAWDDVAYTSVAPWICEFHNVLVHTGAGIVCAGSEVVAETLAQTDAGRHHYQIVPEGILLELGNEVPRLTGTWLSLLAGNSDNYYHWTMDCLGRLAAADERAMTESAQVLVPPLVAEFQVAGFALSGLGQSRAVRCVGEGETVWVERMIVPWSMTGYHQPHPSLRGLFQRFASRLEQSPAKSRPGTRRIYIDRRRTANRRLLNEDEVVSGLERLGFVAMQLENLTLAEQIALFANAEIVVAPHGAGLANILYAPSGCRLIELHMGGWTNWCFRRLAAVCGVVYDCVVGSEVPGPRADWVHSRVWSISVIHVLAAVDRACD